MSVYITTWVWRESRSKGNDLLVLLALADIADDDGICWPSISTIARKTRIHFQTVRSRLNHLRDIGELTWEERTGTSNMFRILITETPTKTATPPRGARSGHQARGPLAVFVGGGTNGSEGGGTNSLRTRSVSDTSLTHQDDQDLGDHPDLSSDASEDDSFDPELNETARVVISAVREKTGIEVHPLVVPTITSRYDERRSRKAPPPKMPERYYRRSIMNDDEFELSQFIHEKGLTA